MFHYVNRTRKIVMLCAHTDHIYMYVSFNYCITLRALFLFDDDNLYRNWRIQPKCDILTDSSTNLAVCHFIDITSTCRHMTIFQFYTRTITYFSLLGFTEKAFFNLTTRLTLTTIYFLPMTTQMRPMVSVTVRK